MPLAGTAPSVTDWLTAIGTVGAVIAAVVLAGWGEEIRRFGSRVKLTILFQPAPPDCQFIEARIPIELANWTVNTAVVRFRVDNNGNAGASNVEARLTRVWKANERGAFELDPDFLPLNLLWAHTEAITTRVIHRGLPKHCNLLEVVDPAGSDWPLTFRFLTEVTPNRVRPGVQPTIKPAGTYRVEVAVTADEAKPFRRTIEVKFSGQWVADEAAMFGKELVVRLV